MSDFITGQEFALYCAHNPEQWKLVWGCKARYDGVGFGIIQPIEGTNRFKIVFKSPSDVVEANDIAAIEITANDFMSGQISHVTINSLPGGHVRQSLKMVERNIAEARPYKSMETCIQSSDSQVERLQPHSDVVQSHKLSHSITQTSTDSTRSEAIRQFWEQRHIRALVHFTRIENLASILKYGLLSRTSLEAHHIPGSFRLNDSDRFDRQQNSISLSISFPNYRMFYRLRNSHAEEWVVLSIAPAVLWELDCAFCVENAASSNVTRISIDERKKFASFQKIFDDCPARKRAELGIPDHYPTNPQAEVLAFGQIPPSMIIDVNFHDAHCKDKWQKNRLPTASTPKLVVKPDYFSARCDYRHWQSIQEPGDDNAIVIDIDDLPF